MLLDRIISNYFSCLAPAACLLAGEKYYADWYGAEMGGLKAIDYGKVSGRVLFKMLRDD